MFEIRTILAPVDFSDHAEAALKYATGLAGRLGATLHLLHVLPEVVPAGPDLMLAPTLPPDYYTESEDRARRDLARALSPGWGPPPEVVAEVRWGGAVEAIVGYAADQAVDLVVISTHGRTGLSHALAGSVAERIVREAPCPVLSVRSR